MARTYRLTRAAAIAPTNAIVYRFTRAAAIIAPQPVYRLTRIAVIAPPASTATYRVTRLAVNATRVLSTGHWRFDGTIWDQVVIHRYDGSVWD